MEINWNNKEPIYLQLRDRLVELIMDGLLSEGDALPSVRQISSEQRINPITVSKAIQILVDDGFRAFAETFVGWHTEGLMPAEGWPAGAGTAYKNAAPLFLDGTVAMHMSGSWMLGNYDKNITNFEWKVVPIPCGTGGCGAMPGGSGVVAFNSSEHPEVAASYIDFLSQAGRSEEHTSELQSRTNLVCRLLLEKKKKYITKKQKTKTMKTI